MNRRMTPLMGWTSWNCFRTDIDEAKLLEQTKLLKDTGLADHGYFFLNIDDGYRGKYPLSGNLFKS